MNKNDSIMALKAAQLRVGHRRSTRRTYLGWLIRYISGLQAGCFSDLQGFLTQLAVNEKLDPKTVRQALNAMVFFYKHVLGRDPGELEVPKVNRNRNEPTWLHHEEVMDLLARMRGVPSLQAALLRRGENIRVIQRQLGHSKVETTEIYTHAVAGDRPKSPLDDAVGVIVPFRGFEKRRHG
jgi:site-specific recombinase XerD